MKKLILLLIPIMFAFTSCGALQSYTMDDSGDAAEDALEDMYQQDMEDMAEDYYEYMEDAGGY